MTAPSARQLAEDSESVNLRLQRSCRLQRLLTRGSGFYVCGPLNDERKEKCAFSHDQPPMHIRFCLGSSAVQDDEIRSQCSSMSATFGARQRVRTPSLSICACIVLADWQWLRLLNGGREFYFWSTLNDDEREKKSAFSNALPPMHTRFRLGSIAVQDDENSSQCASMSATAGARQHISLVRLGVRKIDDSV